MKGAEKLKGGRADGRPDSDFDRSALEAGIAVELEHTRDRQAAKEIAKDHLTEDTKYYEKLKKVEKGTNPPKEAGEFRMRVPTSSRFVRAPAATVRTQVPKPPPARSAEVEKAMEPILKSMLAGELTPGQALRNLPAAEQTRLLRELRKAKQEGLFGSHPSMRSGSSTAGKQMGLFGGEGGGTSGKGPGSRGGHVIGTYPDGSPRYADKPAAKPYGKHPEAGTEGPPQTHGEGWAPVKGSKEGGWKRKGEKTGETPDGRPVHHYDHWFPGGKQKQPSLFDKGEPAADELEKKYMGEWTPSGIKPGTGAAPGGMKPGKVEALGRTPEESESHAKRMGLPTATGEAAPKAPKVAKPPPIPGSRPKPPPVPKASGDSDVMTSAKSVSKGGPPAGSFERIRDKIMSGPGKKPADPDAVAAKVYRQKYGAETLVRRSAAARKNSKATEKAAAVLAGEESLSKAFRSLDAMEQLEMLRVLRKAKGAQMGFGFGEPAKGTPGGVNAPKGYEPVPGSKHGGFRKRQGAGYVYWYPDTGHTHMARDPSDRAAEQEPAKPAAAAKPEVTSRKVAGSAVGPAESADAREIREMKESAKPAEHHADRAHELRDMARRFSATDPVESKHHYALRNAMDQHAVAWERGQGEDADTYDAHSHSRDAQQYEQRPEVQAALAEVKRRDRNLKLTDMSSRRSYPATKPKAKPKDPAQAHHAEAAKLPPQKPGPDARKLDHEMAHRHAFQYHSEQSRAARGRGDSDAEMAHAQAAEAHSTAGNSWSYVRDGRHADSTRAFNLTDIAEGKPGAKEAAAHREKAIEHREKANYHDNHARYATNEGYNAGDSHRKAAEKHELAAKTMDGEHRYQADAASREAERESALAEHSYRLQDHASKGTAHLKAHEFHKKMADQNRLEAQRLRRKNPDSPKAKKAFERQAAHQEAADAHLQASAHHWDARDKLNEWAHPKSRSKWEGQAKGAEEFSAAAHKRSEDAYGASSALGLSPGDLTAKEDTEKSMQPGASKPPGKDPLMKKDTNKGPMREDELRKKGPAAQKGKSQSKGQPPQKGQPEQMDDGQPQPGDADYHRDQAMKHLAAAQAHANAHHSAKKIAETGDHDEKVQAAEEASQMAIKKGAMVIDLDSEQAVLAYLDGGGAPGAAFDTLPDPRGTQRMAALRGGIMQKAAPQGAPDGPGGGVSGGPIYQGEWDGPRGGDNRETAMRLREQLTTVEDDPAGNRGQGGLDEWWRDAYGKASGIETDVNVPVGPMSMVHKAEEPGVQVIDDSDPYTRALYRTDPRDGMAGLRMVYEGNGRDKERRGQ